MSSWPCSVITWNMVHEEETFVVHSNSIQDHTWKLQQEAPMKSRIEEALVEACHMVSNVSISGTKEVDNWGHQACSYTLDHQVSNQTPRETMVRQARAMTLPSIIVRAYPQQMHEGLSDDKPDSLTTAKSCKLWLGVLRLSCGLIIQLRWIVQCHLDSLFKIAGGNPMLTALQQLVLPTWRLYLN